MTFKPGSSLGLEVLIDADFTGNWGHQYVMNDCDTAWSCHGYIIHYKYCLVIWKSQLLTETVLSSMKASTLGCHMHCGRSYLSCDCWDEMKAHCIETGETVAKVKCCIFKDNSSALEMAKVNKFCPCTKHLNVKLHYFCSYMECGDISIHPISSKDQLADHLTKPLTWELLSVCCKSVIGQ